MSSYSDKSFNNRWSKKKKEREREEKKRILLSSSTIILGYQTYTHKEHLSLVNYIASSDLVSERILGIHNKRTWFNNDLFFLFCFASRGWSLFIIRDNAKKSVDIHTGNNFSFSLFSK